jgi:hypothetical protein
MERRIRLLTLIPSFNLARLVKTLRAFLRLYNPTNPYTCKVSAQ